MREQNGFWKVAFRPALGAAATAFLLTGQVFVEGGIWTTKTPMATARSGFAAAVIDGRLHAVGGVMPGPADTYFNAVEVYDPKTNIWTARAPLPAPKAYAAAGVVDSTLYIVDGTSVEAYDPHSNTWTSKAAMPTPRWGLAVPVVDGILYAIGGFRPAFTNIEFNTVEAYEPKTNSWTTKSPMPTNRCCMVAGVIDGLIYVAGGTRTVGHGGTETFATLEVYDPKTDTWTTKSSMPTHRSGAASGVINSELYVIGGTLNRQADLIKSTVEAYDSETDTWRTVVSIPTPRLFAGAGAMDDTLYVVGGYPALAVNEAFSPFLSVAIDIKPGDANNTINLRSNGTILVAILSTAEFGATTVDPATVKLAGAPVATQGRGTPMTSVADLNRDGRLDLLLHFRTQDLELEPAATEVVLKGRTFSGELIRGVDSVRIVP